MPGAPRRAPPYRMDPALTVIAFYVARRAEHWFTFRGSWFVGRLAPPWLQGG